MSPRAAQVPRLLVGGMIAAGGLIILMRDLMVPFGSLSADVLGALQGGAMAALATAVGTLPVLFARSFSQKVSDGLLGFGAGIMLAATSFSLVVPAIAAARASGAGPFGASAIVGSAILLGMGFVILLDALARSEVSAYEAEHGKRRDSLRRAWLFGAAIAIHNLPEGLAIGVAYAGVDLARAQGLATGIALQDIPEGLVVAVTLRTVGYSRAWAAALGGASGLIEPVAAVAGAVLIDITAGLLPWGLAFAAGAMLYVICHHVVPESHQHGHNRVASSTLVAGFVLMMVLDTALA